MRASMHTCFRSKHSRRFRSVASFNCSPNTAYVSIRQHPSASVSIRQHRSILADFDLSPLSTARCNCRDTTLYLCQHMWQQISICRLFQLRVAAAAT
jgi:hypothetical protein